jgi:hypothetical protein
MARPFLHRCNVGIVAQGVDGLRCAKRMGAELKPQAQRKLFAASHSPKGARGSGSGRPPAVTARWNGAGGD